jgi:hypothetical protein
MTASGNNASSKETLSRSSPDGISCQERCRKPSNGIVMAIEAAAIRKFATGSLEGRLVVIEKSDVLDPQAR